MKLLFDFVWLLLAGWIGTKIASRLGWGSKARTPYIYAGISWGGFFLVDRPLRQGGAGVLEAGLAGMAFAAVILLALWGVTYLTAGGAQPERPNLPRPDHERADGE